MAPLRIEIYVVSEFQTNCYFAINDDTKEVLIIDPGASAEKLAEKVKEGVEVRLIYDDVGCVSTLPHRYYKRREPHCFQHRTVEAF